MLSSFARRVASRSATVARQVNGSHLHRMDGYSLIEQATKNGSEISSSAFVVGGRKWELLLYPNGINADHRGFVSAELTLAHGDDNNKEEATATYRVSILDHAGNPAHSATVGPVQFGGSSSRYAARDELTLKKTTVQQLVAAEELRRSAPLLLRNDRLSVQCDVSVVEMDSTRARRENRRRLYDKYQMFAFLPPYVAVIGSFLYYCSTR